jgi:hypothetical protein
MLDRALGGQLGNRSRSPVARGSRIHAHVEHLPQALANM